ncbi:MAG: hypothetical protein R3261_08545 [Alphaproteobacteria bacterium]|nr:hypothetical protein [Alphaproteobacteria bacterium]
MSGIALIKEIAEDWVSQMLGKDLVQNGFVVSVPCGYGLDSSDMQSDIEADFEDFLSFIVDFQAKNKG